MKNRYFQFFLLLIALIACRPDKNVASWEVDVLTPILKTRVNLQDLSTDTSLQAVSDGQLKLVIRQELVNLDPAEVAKPFNETFYYTANIESLELSKQEVNEQLTLGHIARQSGVAGQFILASHGSSQTIPPLTGLGPASFAVDATGFFESMTLRDGWMVLRLENNLPVELTNLNYEIKNQGASTAILQNQLSSLPVGMVHYDSVRLQNNITIEGLLEANLINADSPGSNGQSVPIDTNDALNLKLTIDKLDPIAAKAIFPAQTLFEDTSDARLNAPTALLKEVHVQSGKVFIDVASTVDETVKLEYFLPGMTKNGTSLKINRQVPPAPLNGVSNDRFEIPLEDYTVDLTSLPWRNVYNEFFTIFNGAVDSSGQLTTITLTDSLAVTTGVSEMVSDRGYGFMGYDTSTTESVSPFTAFTNFRGGEIGFQQASLSFEVENYIGADMELKVEEIKAIRGSEEKTLNWSKIGSIESLGKATELVPGQIPQPARTTFSLNEGNSNITELLGILPSAFEAKFTAYMNRGMQVPDFDQFLYAAHGVKAYLDAEVPLNLTLEDLRLIDTVSFQYDDIDPKGRLEGGELKILADNFYPFDADLEIVLIDDNQSVLDTLITSENVVSADTDANGRAVQMVSSSLHYPLTKAMLSNLKLTRKMAFRIRLNTSAGGQPVKFYSDNYLDLQLVGNLSMNTE